LSPIAYNTQPILTACRPPRRGLAGNSVFNFRFGHFRHSLPGSRDEAALPSNDKGINVLDAYRKHVAERSEQGIVPKPLDAAQVAALVELLKNPPAGEEAFLLDLISNRVPAGVDEAAYVKAGFLSAIATGEATSPILDKPLAVKLLGTMLGGYNISTLVKLLDDAELAPLAAKELNSTLLMFDAFQDRKSTRLNSSHVKISYAVFC